MLAACATSSTLGTWMPTRIARGTGGLVSMIEEVARIAEERGGIRKTRPASHRHTRCSVDLPCKSGEPSPMKDSGGGDEQEQTKTIYERVQTGGGAADADQRTQRRAGCK